MSEHLWRRSNRQLLSILAPTAGVVYWGVRSGADGRALGLWICSVLLVLSLVVNAVIVARSR